MRAKSWIPRLARVAVVFLAATAVSCTSDSDSRGSARHAAASNSTTSAQPARPLTGEAPAKSPNNPLADDLAQLFARRVEFGKDSGVFLEVPRDPVDTLTLFGLPATQAGFAASGGCNSIWPSQTLTARPLAAGQHKRVVVRTEVCLRQGYLEHLFSHGGKRHESILWADVDCSLIHAALLAAGAKPGRTVQFRNPDEKREFQPASGERIRITLQYEEKGKVRTVPAQKWIRYAKSKKELQRDWVFAGSYRYKDPDGNVHYAANSGRYICVTNFADAMLDLPFESQDGDPQHGLDFEANTEALPPLETKVLMILEPMGVAEQK